MNGVLVVDKPAGWTSHDIVNKARRLLQERRVGHTGTLDPLATGVLVLCVGKATRLARYLEADDKEYTAELRLGVVTDTQDAEGRMLETRSYAQPALAQVSEALAAFRGEIRQRPPAYSAVKVDGVPSYKLARKGTAKALPERQVVIHRIELLEYRDPMVRFSVHCSKGTYVRSLCADIGERLGTGAHLTALRRTRSGRFTLEQALTMERLAELAASGDFIGSLISPSGAMAAYPAVTLPVRDADRLAQGNAVAMPPGVPAGGSNGPVRVLGEQGELVAMARLRDGALRPETVVR